MIYPNTFSENELASSFPWSTFVSQAFTIFCFIHINGFNILLHYNWGLTQLFSVDIGLFSAIDFWNMNFFFLMQSSTHKYFMTINNYLRNLRLIFEKKNWSTISGYNYDNIYIFCNMNYCNSRKLFVLLIFCNKYCCVCSKSWFKNSMKLKLF